MDAASGTVSAMLKGHAELVTSLAFSADGRMVASASQDRSVRVWDIASRKMLLTFVGHAGPVTALAFSPNGRRVVSASSDGKLKFWSIDR
jgi:WD40 repeat protein